jgi:hypothetical protein
MVSGREHASLKPLPLGASKAEKSRQYEEVLARINALLEGKRWDHIAFDHAS